LRQQLEHFELLRLVGPAQKRFLHRVLDRIAAIRKSVAYELDRFFYIAQINQDLRSFSGSEADDAVEKLS
jgi:hypothetical protein